MIITPSGKVVLTPLILKPRYRKTEIARKRFLLTALATTIIIAASSTGIR